MRSFFLREASIPGLPGLLVLSGQVAIGDDALMDEDYRDAIRERAYELWELAGKPEDMEDSFWLEAEKQIHKERIESGGETWDNL